MFLRLRPQIQRNVGSCWPFPKTGHFMRGYTLDINTVTTVFRQGPRMTKMRLIFSLVRCPVVQIELEHEDKDWNNTDSIRGIQAHFVIFPIINVYSHMWAITASISVASCTCLRQKCPTARATHPKETQTTLLCQTNHLFLRLESPWTAMKVVKFLLLTTFFWSVAALCSPQVVGIVEHTIPPGVIRPKNCIYRSEHNPWANCPGGWSFRR